MSWAEELINCCRGERERSAVRLTNFESGELRLCQGGQDITHLAIDDCRTTVAAMDKVIALTMTAAFSNQTLPQGPRRP